MAAFISRSPLERQDNDKGAMAQLGQHMAELLHELGFVIEAAATAPQQPLEPEPKNKRRRDNSDDEETQESRTYNCELEFEVTTGGVDAADQTRDDSVDSNGSDKEYEPANEFTVSLRLVYVIKPEISLVDIPINMYITKSELIKYLMDRLVLRRSEDAAATDLYSIQSKIKKLLSLVGVRCCIDGCELDLYRGDGF
ncbi:hypothetical protein CANMA_003022 [Candida margitis]|uniref:uncharacterized protein n=1 Tax=Candida margitis TaxID=1775924 RepID=UPI0022275297|nr:uncharacterized protein CANMA_003022 [Candida margitis]KAI5967476.1 hypothetical protein CANMA_003022 [Candida margitis]